MIGKPFINDALSHSIELYLKYKDKPEEPVFQSFLVVVIRTLVFIYGELDILNPYITQNEHNMGGFDNNIMKFGFSKEDLDHFKNLFLEFVEEEKKNAKPNVAFLRIEKYLIDMFFLKVTSLHLKEEDKEKFKAYLYIPENTNSYIQKDMDRFLLHKNELVLYFQSKNYESQHTFDLEPVKRNTLIPEAYLLLGYSLEQVANLTDQDLNAINNQIYRFFRVDSHTDNKEELLEKAVNYYKRYGNRITSGNGYVDFLLFASIVATTVFLAVLFMFHYL